MNCIPNVTQTMVVPGTTATHPMPMHIVPCKACNETNIQNNVTETMVAPDTTATHPMLNGATISLNTISITVYTVPNPHKNIIETILPPGTSAAPLTLVQTAPLKSCNAPNTHKDITETMLAIGTTATHPMLNGIIITTNTVPVTANSSQYTKQ